MIRRLLIILSSLFFLAVVAGRATAATPVTNRIIVIDPGHGGSDPGSTECLLLTEAEANLDIAERLYALLDSDGAEVFLTRTDDSTKSNRDRYELANSVEGEALVSIHLNGSTDHSVNGTMGLYGKKNKDEDFTRVLHSHLVNDLAPVPDEGATNFASGVLLKSNMPATMQETVYISNIDECSALTDGTGTRQQQIAQSLYDGLIDWFSQTGSGDGGNGGGGNGGGRKCENPPCNNK